MARAVGISAPGGPEVLEVIDRPVREPGEGEVRIRVAATAVNPTDIGCGRPAPVTWRRRGRPAWTRPARSSPSAPACSGWRPGSW